MTVFAYGSKLPGVSHTAIGKLCEDNFCISGTHAGAVIAAVCDGVGSDAHAEMASAVASRAAVEYCAAKIQPAMRGDSVEAMIYQAMNAAYVAVEEAANQASFDRRHCNTTLDVAVLVRDDLYFGHIGDSGIFAMLDDGTIRPITHQQNDENGGVFPLFDRSHWITGQVDGRVAAVLLSTDGMWSYFHPKRSPDAKDKHSIALLDWFMDPGFIPVRTKDTDDPTQALQAWLDTEMAYLNENCVQEVLGDDITVVVLQDTEVPICYQPDAYYKVPTDFEDEDCHGVEQSVNDSQETAPTALDDARLANPAQNVDTLLEVIDPVPAPKHSADEMDDESPGPGGHVNGLG